MIPFEEIDTETKNIVKNAQERFKANIDDSPRSSAENANIHAICENAIEESHIDMASLSLLNNTAEHKCAKIKHINVINYENVIMDIINDTFAFIAG